MLDRPSALLLIAALSNAALHASLPSHWLSFALVGRAQRWSANKTLAVTAAAGAGHMLLTACLGLVLASFGKEIQSRIPERIEHLAPALVLGAIGAVFLSRALLSRARGQTRSAHSHSHAGSVADATEDGAKPASLTMGALILGVTLSPCIELLSIYAAAAHMKWNLLLLMSLLIILTTVGLMMLFVRMTLHGLRHIRFDWLEANEGLVFGAILLVLAGMLWFSK